MLLRNDGGNRNRWLGLKLTGSKSNRDGVGAKVTLKIGSSRRSKQLLGGASYFAASDLRLLFGLGDASKVDEVEVRWPSGALTTLKDVPVNRYLNVREDAGPPARR